MRRHSLRSCLRFVAPFALPAAIGMIAAAAIFQGAPSASHRTRDFSDSAALPTSSSVSSPQPKTSNPSTTEAAGRGKRPATHLPVPFSPQAPFAVWDDLHQEACEEMSLIMVHHFLEGTPLSREDADGELYAMIAWAFRNGFDEDTTIEETASIARGYYGYTATVYAEEQVTADRIRALLAEGKPVIVPAQGQMLENPHFSGDGPPYHMLVIIGFDEDGKFITNDPGTRRGEGYRYAEDILMHAIHDWTGAKETVHEGGRGMLVVEKI